jgi:soluble cytochrome b562
MKRSNPKSSRTWLACGLIAGLTAVVGLAVGVDDPPAPAPAATQPAPQEPAQRGPRGEGGQGRERPGQPGGREGARAVVSVEASMKIMGRALRTLKSQAGDAAKRDENLRLVNDMQRGCVTAKGSPVPEDLLKKAATEPDKTKIKETYRKGLVDLLRKLIDLEDAIADGKGDAAKGIVEEVIKMRDKLHEDMGVKED